MEYAKIDSLKFVLPAHWASYLINADATGYTDDEIFEMDAFVLRNGLGFCTNVSEESWFHYRNDANNLGADVAEFTFSPNL
jgi:hypothetical protein